MSITLKKLAALLLALTLIAAALPALALSAEDYNTHDVEKLRAFFLITGASTFQNGVAINGSGFDPDDPATWTSCTWTSSGRLKTITFSDLGWNVSGSLDLSGCTSLTTVKASDCFIDSIDVTGCTALKSLDVTGDRLTSVNVSTNSALELLCRGGQRRYGG